MDLQSAAERLRDKNLNAWPVARDGKLWGLLTVQSLEAMTDSKMAIGDLFEPGHSSVHVHLDHPLTIALERMGAAGVEALPVVSRADVQRLLGIVTLPEVLNAYGLEPTRRPPD